MTGTSIVVRNFKGQWMLGAYQKRYLPSPLVAEIFAIRMGLMVAKE